MKISTVLVLPAVVILGAFFVVPLIWVFILSFLGAGPTGEVQHTFTLGNYARFLTDSYYVNDLLLRTIRLAAIATLFSVVIGYLGAFVIVRASPAAQTWMILLVMLPLWVNLVVRTLSLMVVLGRNGLVNQILVGIGISARPLPLLYNETAVVIGMVQVAVPFVVMSVYGVLQAIPRQLEQAAMTVGANPLSAFRRVTLPLSVPGILAGSVLAFGINVESFVVPILLGGGRVRFMSVAAYETATVSNNLPFAATIGVILLIVTMVMLGVYQWAVRSAGRPAPAVQAA
ncbi:MULTISPECIES: ABC transporter permease [unclassified Chelatococcus]|jgi:ABC-type spermidine/putrescine transport system permease subunit I|uniref:ABC transporter permease n=1 Tax=unclassified Chelatococcus TaxID=2638111 RepID=UPI001BCD9E2D|nr:MULTISPECIES: ABC transporter permease [unclassified Chelatococcus]CAH1660879.1 putative spermidine/putrescine transport system permease protein [Hyphomicrobiales bacterium]MBS7741182.1 ABC transporter permease [Chelatococcus sp. HY11]MBX3545368.1 ABC transporter permease [Chelatococcus sp.]MCO5078003.1 ABC transporter permease [Chelatococcus sp.]CAH1683266.1 putative spermidine/putrescine transport system permease protein [Hyphomicrobiales bacterium]